MRLEDAWFSTMVIFRWCDPRRGRVGRDLLVINIAPPSGVTVPSTPVIVIQSLFGIGGTWYVLYIICRSITSRRCNFVKVLLLYGSFGPWDIPYEIRGAENGIFERWRLVRCDPVGVGIITVSRLKTYDPVEVWVRYLFPLLKKWGPSGSGFVTCSYYWRNETHWGIKVVTLLRYKHKTR